MKIFLLLFSSKNFLIKNEIFEKLTKSYATYSRIRVALEQY